MRAQGQPTQLATSMDVEGFWTVEELFSELIEPIVSFLDISSVGRLLSVCKQLSYLPSMQRVWKVVVEENFWNNIPLVCLCTTTLIST